MDNRTAKYAKERCCVCAKYGASAPFGEPLRALQLMAKSRALTLKLPDDNAIHEKCLRKLKLMISQKKNSK